MFLFCQIKEKSCAFCGTSNNNLYCGIEKGDNKISIMKKCPLKTKKKR